jgi:hypothetical protein
MLRGLGLAVALWHGTGSDILTGALVDLPVRFRSPEDLRRPDIPRPPWLLTTGPLPRLSNYFDKATGLSPSLTVHPTDEHPLIHDWRLRIPEELKHRMLVGDDLTVRLRFLVLPIVGMTTHLRYEVGRDRELRSYGAAGNRKFILLWGAVAGGPLFLWEVICGATLLCRLGRKPYRPTS